MSQTFTLVCVIALTQQAFAQFTDHFSDGEFTSAPAWAGDVSKFTVVAGQLRLQATAENSTAYLSTISQSINNASWEFYVSLAFNPSSTNYARVYLTSTAADLAGSLNGYFVMIGDTQDEVSLYRQTGTGRTKIIDGADGILNTATVNLRVKVTRNAAGQWSLLSDAGATGTYSSEGSADDITHTTSAYAGLYCAYTATRSDKFIFDAFVVAGEPFVDNSAPQWQAVTVASPQTLQLVFDEALDKTTAENTTNYLASNGIGNPTSASLLADAKSVMLAFVKPFSNGVTSTLTLNGIKDLHGNAMSGVAKTFMYFQPVAPLAKDIVITEILADPSPAIGLPDAEFIEIFNRSANPFDLAGWILTDGSSTAILPSSILLPGEYRILTATASALQFQSFGLVIPVSNFPTVNNAADKLVLKSPLQVTIDSVSYTSAWYGDEDKMQGGWSVEIIDPHNICAQQNNWRASEHAMGGTPGAVNSVLANNPDLTAPKLVSIVPLSAQQIEIQFNERLDKVLPQLQSFQFIPTRPVASVVFADESLKTIHVALGEPLLKGVAYELEVTNIYDCAGNVVTTAENKVRFALPEAAGNMDVVINEVLFNPRSTGVDFVEVYNRSSKFIDLRNWKIARVQDEQLADAKTITDSHLLFAPGDYLVLTTNANVVKGEYIQAKKEKLFTVPALPPMNDDEGSVVLMAGDEQTIDQFFYNDQMHSPFIQDAEGVSLERIDADTQTNATFNWRSASSDAGFATPGFVNSGTANHTPAADAVNIEPEIFEPGTGTQNFAEIRYRFDQGGRVGNIKIFDQQGRAIRQIANNELLGTQGFFRWDGDCDDGTRARTGYYMVWFEVFNPGGVVQTFRKRVAVASRF